MPKGVYDRRGIQAQKQAKRKSPQTKGNSESLTCYSCDGHPTFKDIRGLRGHMRFKHFKNPSALPPQQRDQESISALSDELAKMRIERDIVMDRIHADKKTLEELKETIHTIKSRLRDLVSELVDSDNPDDTTSPDDHRQVA